MDYRCGVALFLEMSPDIPRADSTINLNSFSMHACDFVSKSYQQFLCLHFTLSRIRLSAHLENSETNELHH